MQTTKQSAIVFGATGAIGTELIQILSREHEDWEILAISRSESSWKSSRLASLSLPNVRPAVGEPIDRSSVLSLSRPCDLIFCCVGFHKYEAKYWAEHWPGLVDNLLEAVKVPSDKAGQTKKLVFCDNLYAYGSGDISVNNTRISDQKLNSKPAVRAFLHSKFLKHMKESPGSLAIVGGADFFGPHVTDKSFFGDTMAAKMAKGSMSAMALGSADVVHDFCYVPDFAMAMAVSAVRPEAVDRFWICPHSIHGKTLRQIAHDVAKKFPPVGEKKVSVTVIGPVMIAILSPFMSMLKEFKEMLPLWTRDYKVDDSPFIEAFGVEATPYDDALQALVDYFVEREMESSAKKPTGSGKK